VVTLAGAVILRVRDFYLDDLGSHLAELADTGRSCPRPTEVDHFDVRERHERLLSREKLIGVSIHL
jgi:hypothetical protein